MDMLEIETDRMADFEAVLVGSLLSKLVIIVAKLSEIKLDLTVERHLFHSFGIFFIFRLLPLKAGGNEIKSDQLAKA